MVCWHKIFVFLRIGVVCWWTKLIKNKVWVSIQREDLSKNSRPEIITDIHLQNIFILTNQMRSDSERLVATDHRSEASKIAVPSLPPHLCAALYSSMAKDLYNIFKWTLVTYLCKIVHPHSRKSIPFAQGPNSASPPSISHTGGLTSPLIDKRRLAVSWLSLATRQSSSLDATYQLVARLRSLQRGASCSFTNPWVLLQKTCTLGAPHYRGVWSAKCICAWKTWQSCRHFWPQEVLNHILAFSIVCIFFKL